MRQYKKSQISTSAILDALTLMLALSIVGSSLSCTKNAESTASSSVDTGTTPTPTPTPTPAPQSTFTVYISHESVGVYRIPIDVDLGTSGTATSASLTALFGAGSSNASNRNLAVNASGDIVSGHHSSLVLPRLDGNLGISTSGSLTLTGGSGIAGVYAHCYLPNGNIIAGTDQWGAKKAVEFDSSGAFLRNFNSATQTWTFSDCKAISNTRVVWVDQNSSTDQDGDLVLSDFNGTTWSETARYVTNTQLSGKLASTFYSVVSHTNGYLYAFPFVGSVTRNAKVLKCSASGTLSDCTLVGVDLDTVSATVGVIQGVQQLPNREEIIFVSDDRKLYSFKPSNDTTTVVTDLTAKLANPGCCELRGLVVK